MIMVNQRISKALCGRVRSLSVLTFQTVEDEQTMRNISDIIEQYLKSILQESPEGTVEIQRNDLAEQFSCVPSQINYVISTRFTLEKGFLVESKRGGADTYASSVSSFPSILHSSSTFIIPSAA